MWEVNSADNAYSPVANTNTCTYRTRQQYYLLWWSSKVKADLTGFATAGLQKWTDPAGLRAGMAPLRAN